MSDFAVTATPIAPAETAPPAERIATLDIVRGIAVMGILAMNIVAFAMPFQAYMNPTAYGLESPADLASWAFSFVLIDGKMRGLFSFLFGASTLLVIERAEAAGRNAAFIHYSRMAWLLVFGLLHFYFIWFGDILSMYALVGLVLYAFRGLSVRALVRWGVGLLVLQTALMAAIAAGAWYLSTHATLPGAPADEVRQWHEMQEGFTPLAGAALNTKMGLFLGSYSGIVESRLIGQMFAPFTGLPLFFSETLAYMLFGMAALKSGFFRGDWDPVRYRKWALVGFGTGIPVYILLGWLQYAEGFSVRAIFAFGLAGTTPVRPVMIVAIASLIVLLTRKGGGLVPRIAAAGRAAFTNYLGTSILMTTFFYGYGLAFYGSFSRIELWLVVISMWALMLLWSKPWLDRFRYGPFEWLWRSLARFEIQPMRKG